MNVSSVLALFNRQLFESTTKSAGLVMQTGGNAYSDIVTQLLDVAYRYNSTGAPIADNDHMGWLKAINAVNMGVGT